VGNAYVDVVMLFLAQVVLYSHIAAEHWGRYTALSTQYDGTKKWQAFLIQDSGN
jgi:hypothetical protein